MAARQSAGGPFAAGQWAHQDGLRLRGACFAGDDDEAHPQQRWERRAPDAYADLSIRAAWREAEPLDYDHDEEARRLHRPTGLVICARLGAIRTVLPYHEVDHEVEERAGASPTARPDGGVSSSEIRFTEDNR